LGLVSIAPDIFQALVVTRSDERLFIGLGFLLAQVAAAGCKKAPPPQQGPLPVNVVTVIEKEVNEWDEFTGRLEAVESVESGPASLVMSRQYI
jgi:multidrug efflux pump subunit AcrA (membrane-fusion protein)